MTVVALSISQGSSELHDIEKLKMSSGDVRKVSRQDIQLVQNLIERCLQLYMNQKEVVETLLTQAKIEPGFTELVWLKLEEENREFFRAYHVRLMLKNQIIVFNKLIEKQVELMHKGCPGIASVPPSNGSNTSTSHQIPSCYLPEHASTSSRPDAVHRNGGSSSSIMNGAPSGHQSIQHGNDASIITGNMDASTSMFSTQNSHMGRHQEMDGPTVKSEPSYSSNSDFAFCIDSSFLESRLTIGEAPGASFSSSELTVQPLNEPLLDIDTSSFGFLSQIRRNFSFSDLTNEFSQGADILESYGRSPFLAPEANNFMDSPEMECKGENRRLDTISEGISYDDFGSD